MKLTKREMKLLVLAVLIIGGSFFYNWGLKPLISKQQSLEKRLAAKKQQWAKEQRLLQESDFYKKTLGQAQAEARALEALTFAGDINNAQLKGLSILETQIKHSGLAVKNKELRVADEDNPTYDLIYYDFALVGSFKAVIAFLKGLNKENKLFIIENLQLIKLKQGSSLEIKVALKTIVIKT